ncbi:MAG: hypothetical protein H7251_14280 [Acetobacteraceae bacterium]|nr:hypothetical protein [Acetobacteraceae bacterium]
MQGAEDLMLHATSPDLNLTHEIVLGSLRRPDTPRGAVLLMTATLRPPADAVARADPAARLLDYAAALKFYLAMPATVVDRIVFADNSAGGIAGIRDIVASVAHDKAVEIMSFAGNDHPVSAGKAYGEFKLIDIAIAHASLIRADDIVWKTTGRLKILNLAALHRAVTRAGVDIACDLHNVPLIGSGRWRGNQRMDLRLFAFRPAAFAKVYSGIWAGMARFDEATMYATTLAARKSIRVMPRFPVQPMIEGVSGRHQRNYAAPGQRIKAMMRQALRIVLPFLWI